ncbi:MAG: hypothetical protein CL843_17525 [Crocinitomicaceae bacterium]|nr:hypothetical protein [Crocinitomicaceae bacterium]|tara:strand:+ start:10108 stop:10341 length:234 start_codon:yes stop_codon:yes gene_type:complete
MADQKPQNNEKKKQLNTLARFAGVGFQMLAIIGLGTWFGIWLDGDNADFPLYALIFSLLSVFIALYLVIREVIQNSK